MKTLLVLVSVMVVLFLAAPNRIEAQKRKAATPIEATVNAGLRYRVTAESGGALLLTSFRKTNGYEKGYGVYVIEWQADISVMQDIWKGGDFFVGNFQDFRVMAREPGTLDSIGQSPKHFNKGTTIRLTGDATLRKTEQGWRIEGLSVKTSQVGPIVNGVSQSTSKLSSYPSESTARQIMEDYLARLFPPNRAGSMSLRSFTKTNGMGHDKHYTLGFDAVIESLLTKQGLAEAKRRGVCAAEATEADCIKPRKRSGKLHFEKTENGWRSVNSDEDIGNALAK